MTNLIRKFKTIFKDMEFGLRFKLEMLNLHKRNLRMHLLIIKSTFKYVCIIMRTGMLLVNLECTISYQTINYQVLSCTRPKLIIITRMSYHFSHNFGLFCLIILDEWLKLLHIFHENTSFHLNMLIYIEILRNLRCYLNHKN